MRGAVCDIGELSECWVLRGADSPPPIPPWARWGGGVLSNAALKTASTLTAEMQCSAVRVPGVPPSGPTVLHV